MKKILLLLVVASFFTACQVSTTSIDNVQSCPKTDFDADANACKLDTTVFATDTDEIYVTADVSGAPDGTQVTFAWKYITDPTNIDSVILTLEDSENTVNSSLEKPTNGWPAGDYEIDITTNWDNVEPIAKKFTVEVAE